MPRAAPIQSSFAIGEITPFGYARTDDERRKQGLALCQNFVPLVQGPVTRRPGTKFIAEVKNSAAKTMLFSFEFGDTQSYQLEFGNLYVRFFSDHGVVGAPLEVVTPYLTADLPSLRMTESADVLYITHKKYAPRKLIRTSALAWTLSIISFLDGPYLPLNVISTTLTPSASAGAITLTASAPLFATTDVGRLVRMLHGAVWGYAQITGYTNTTVVSATVKSNFGAATPQTTWRLGAWSDTTGYPAAVCFFEDRLVFSGATATLQRVDGSQSADYENFAPTTTAGVVLISSAVSYTLLARKSSPVYWMLDNDKGLVIGARNGEWLLRPSVNSEALSPVNVNAKQVTTNGSANVAAVDLEKSIVYAQKGGRQIRDFYFDVSRESYVSPDVSRTGEHMTQSGIIQMAVTKTPQPMVWMVRADGVLVGMTYNKEDRILGWHRHVLGGQDAKVESIAVTPDPTGTYDELTMIVSRTVNGATVRYVEYMTKFWETTDQLSNAFYVDCGLTYTGVPLAQVGGLSHLVGEYVDILADGARHPALQVGVDGSITLAQEASTIQAGLPVTSIVKLLPVDAGAADGTSLAKTKRADHVGFWFMDTVGGKFGATLDALNLFLVRQDQDPMDTAPQLFSGSLVEAWDGDYEREGSIYVVQDAPFPMTLLAVAPRVVTQDAG